jgi:competence protein ComEC
LLLAASRSPALYAALALGGGILLAWQAWRPPLWWAAAAVVFAVAALVFRRQRPCTACVTALCALAMLGALSLGARSTEWSDCLRAQAIAPYLDGSEVTITAHVLRDGTVRSSGSDRRQMVDVETEEMQSTIAGRRPTAAAGIRLTVYSREDSEDDDSSAITAARQFVYGERVRFTAKLREPRNFGNPGAWDYRAYLSGQGVTALASVRADRLEILPGFAGNRIRLWRSRARRSVLARIHSLWDARRAPLIDAMLIGDKAGIERQTRTDFQRTGVFHILVVSGMNVGILAFVVFWVLRRMRFSEAACSGTTVMLSLGYAGLTDGGAPILRATFMLAIYLGTRLLYRERAPLNAVGVAGLLLLAVDPRALFDASFQLTFLSVLAIAGVGVPLLERTSEP